MRFLPLLVCFGWLAAGCDDESDIAKLPESPLDAAVADAGDVTPDENDAALDIECEAGDCPEGLICNMETMFCVSDKPVLADVSAYKWGDFLSLKFHGTDNGANVNSVRIGFVGTGGQIYDFGGGMTSLVMQLDEKELALLTGKKEFDGKMRISGLSSIADPAYTRIALVDQNGLESEVKVAQIVDQPRAQQGEKCDLSFVDNVCVEGADCFLTDSGDAECVMMQAPVISSLEAFYNTQTNALGLLVKGQTFGYDVNGFQFSFFTGADEKIPYQSAYSDKSFETFEYVISDGNDYTGVVNWPLDTTMSVYDWDHLELRLVDTAGQMSVAAKGNFSEPPLLPFEQKAKCDLNTALNRCTPPELCMIPVASTGIPASVSQVEELFIGECSIPSEGQKDCPSGWQPKTLTDAGNGIYKIDDSLENASATTLGSCVYGRTPSNVYTFKAPKTGRWTFETSSEDPGIDTILFARRYCKLDATDALDNELACNDDRSTVLGAEDASSEISFDLNEGEVIYLFVAYFAWSPNPWMGNYTLTASVETPH